MKLLVSLFSLFIYGTIAFSQSNELVLHFTNDTNKGVFGTYEKVEIGVELPAADKQKIMNFLLASKVSNADKVNPFLAWELDVEGLFTHVESGQTVKVPGFFFRDFKRDTVKNAYVSVDVNDNIRIRFAAPLPGEWSCEVSYKIKEKQRPQKSRIDFVVKESGKKGFIQVHENKRNFVHGNDLVVPVGTNFPYPMKGVEIYHTIKDESGKEAFDPFTTNTVVKPKAYLSYFKDIDSYHKQGGKYFRTLQSGWASLLEFEVKGNYFNRLHYAWEQDSLLNYCEANDMYFSFNLMQQEPFMKYGNYDMYDWDWSNYRNDGTYGGKSDFPMYCYSNEDKKEPHEMFTNEMDLLYHEQRIRYYMARYGYSSNIYMFELLSEPWHLNQYNSVEPSMTDTKEGELCRKALLSYHTRMAQYIHQQLPHVQQLIGVDIHVGRIYDGDKYIDSSIYSPYIDVIGFNPYTPNPEKMVITKSGANNVVDEHENSMFRLVNLLNSKASKPIMIFEGGAGDGVDEKSGYAQQRIDMMSFPFVGLAGFNSWVGWYYGHDAYWYNIIASEKFINSPVYSSVIMQNKGNWTQGRQIEKKNRRDKKSTKELQYYLSANANLVVGYVKNRTYNFHTQSTDSIPNNQLGKDLSFATSIDITFKDGKDLVIEGLKKGKTVEIIWYAFDTGKEYRRDVVKSKKNLALKHPDLKVTDPANLYPLFWFRLEVKD